MKPDLAVIHSPVGGGHKAAALAVAEAARDRGLAVEIVDAFAYAPSAFGRAYLGAHLAGQGAAPSLYGSAYFAANHRDGALDPVRRGFDQLVFHRLMHRVCAMEPRAVVATHHLPLVVLGPARRRGWLRAPLVGVVTDYTAHACWAERGVDGFCVPCPIARHELLLHGVAPDRIALTGIPVRAAFERVAPLVDPAPGEPLRVLVTSGGFGVGPMARVVRGFAGVHGVELTVVCGSARRVEARVRAIAAEVGLQNATIVGFEKDMPARVAEAHVVVGKAGGLTVSEALAAGRPMVIVGAVPGNEKINEEHVVRAGAGVAADPSQVASLVVGLRKAGALAAMGRRARDLVPARSAPRVLDWTEALIARIGRRAA